jgi:hypothetical protein
MAAPLRSWNSAAGRSDGRPEGAPVPAKPVAGAPGRDGGGTKKLTTSHFAARCDVVPEPRSSMGYQFIFRVETQQGCER